MMVASLISVVIALLGVSAQQPPPTDAIRAMVKSYLEIQTGLASDRFEDVKAPARMLAAQAVALGPASADIAASAAALEKAADITAAREALGPLSDALIARVRADDSKEAVAGLRLAYCPMARRSWLQRDEQIRNPYYGSKMLICGEFKPLK